MMQTKQGLIADLKAMSEENSRTWELAMALLRNQGIETVGTFKEDGWTVTVKLVNPTRAHGGIVAIHSKLDGQNDSCSVSWLEQEYSYRSRKYNSGMYDHKMNELIHRAMAIRNKAIAA